MKPILLCIVFLAASAWSASNLVWTQFQFEKGYLDIDTTKICNVDSSNVNCSLEKGLAYYSTLDTGYAVLFEPSVVKIQIFKYPSTQGEFLGGNNKLDQVLRYEFVKWVEWGIIKMTKDSAQHLIEKILGPGQVEIGGISFTYKKVCDEDPSQCRAERVWGGGASAEVPDEDIARLPQKKFQIDMSGSQADTNEKPLGIQKNFAPIPRIVPPGTGYKAFDMNGVYLYRGAWNGSFTVHGNPVILKFDNGRTAVFR